MFDKLNNLNFATCSYEELRTLVCQTIPDLQVQATEELLRRFSPVSQPAVFAKVPKYPENTIAKKCDRIQEELSNINEDDFDVILDTTANSLKFRKDPSGHTPLKVSKLQKIGGYRLQILAYMLEKPDFPFHYENYSPSEDIRVPSAFNKTIAAFRDAFEQKDLRGPYIIKQPDGGGVTGNKRGYVYKVNPDLHYLIIRHDRHKISGKIRS